MAKVLKNTTLFDIELTRIGITIPASDQITISEKDYIQLSTQDSIAQLSPLIASGDVIVNDGINDINILEALDFLRFPDSADSIRFLSQPEKNNGFTSKTTQAAIEEVRNLALASTPVVYTVTGTSTVSRTATSFVTIPGMTLTPPEGKYLVIFNASVGTTGVNTQAEITIGKASLVQVESTRLIRNTANILGLVTLSTNNSEGGHTASLVLEVDGTEEIVAAFRHISGGSIEITNRTLTCVRVFDEGELSATLPISESSHSALNNLLNDDHPQYLPLTGIRGMNGDLDLGLNKITSLATGTNPNDAVNKAQLDLAISSIGSSPVDFSFQSAISVNTDSSFSAGNKGVAVKAGRDTLIDVLGSARLGQNASLIVDSNGSVRVRSHS